MTKIGDMFRAIMPKAKEPAAKQPDSAMGKNVTDVSMQEVFSTVPGKTPQPASDSLKKNAASLTGIRTLQENEASQASTLAEGTKTPDDIQKQTQALGKTLEESESLLNDLEKILETADKRIEVAGGYGTGEKPAAQNMQLLAKKAEVQLSNAARDLKATAHRAVQYLGDAGQGIKEKADSAAQGLQKAALNLKEKAHSAGEAIKEAAQSAKQAVKTAANVVREMTMKVARNSLLSMASGLSKLAQGLSNAGAKIDTLGTEKLQGADGIQELRKGVQEAGVSGQKGVKQAHTALHEKVTSEKAKAELSTAQQALDKAKGKQSAADEARNKARTDLFSAQDKKSAADRGLTATKEQLKEKTGLEKKFQDTLHQLQNQRKTLEATQKKLALNVQNLEKVVASNDARAADVLEQLGNNPTDTLKNEYNGLIQRMMDKQKEIETTSHAADAVLADLERGITDAQNALNALKGERQDLKKTLEDQQKDLKAVSMDEHKAQLAHNRAQQVLDKANRAEVKTGEALNKVEIAQQSSLQNPPPKKEE